MNDIEPDTFNEMLVHGDFTAQQLVSRYCKVLHKSLGTYEAVARRTELDRRTVKKYVNS